MRVLDVGAASGWFAFYFEQLDADVTAFDLRSAAELDTYGRFEPLAEPFQPRGCRAPS